MYIDDPGVNNAVVGHRRWKLYPQLAVVGSGDAGTVQNSNSGSYANNIMVLSTSSTFGASFGTGRTEPAFVAWPNAGYTPHSLLPTSRRWSFTLQTGDFSSASVTVNGAAATITQRVSGFQPTIVFDGADPSDWAGTEIRYDIIITGITGATQPSYSYSVTVYDALTPDSPTCTEMTSTYSSVCYGGTWTYSGFSGGRVYFTSTSEVFCTGAVLYIYWAGSAWWMGSNLGSSSGFARNPEDVARPQDISGNTWQTYGSTGYETNSALVFSSTGCATNAPTAPITAVPTSAPTLKRKSSSSSSDDDSAAAAAGGTVGGLFFVIAIVFIVIHHRRLAAQNHTVTNVVLESAHPTISVLRSTDLDGGMQPQPSHAISSKVYRQQYQQDIEREMRELDAAMARHGDAPWVSQPAKGLSPVSEDDDTLAAILTAHGGDHEHKKLRPERMAFFASSSAV